MGVDVGFPLRPEWVLQIAREVDVFVRSLAGARTDASHLDRFFTSLPPPERDLERQFLDDLRHRLSCSHGLVGQRSPAERAQQLIVADYGKPWTLAELARAVGCNRTTLQQEFQELTGTTVHRFLVQRRVAVAAQLLADVNLKISSISLEVGYRSHSAFARRFKIVTGVTLTRYRKTRHGSAAFRDRVPVE
ncbi:MAG TPA: AraC family transcriptional regulator [Vicinamibacterales bacterium]